MNVLTIYNHGTGGSSTKGYDKLEIVNCFGNLHRNFDAGGLRLRWYITEGVGSKLDPANVGQLVFDENRMILRTAEPSRGGLFSGTRHQASGEGVQQNVQNVLTLLRFLKASKRVPDVINMIGWSRGAVTCIRQASEIWRDGTLGLAGVPINIYAIDPVAGADADRETQGSVLYPNVRNFVACLALGERRSTFQPKTQTKLAVMSPSVTRTAFLHFPGIHSDVAKINGEPGIVTFDLCARFLRHHGTVVPAHSGFLSSPDRLLQAYFNMALGAKRIGTRVIKGKKAEEHKGWKDKNTGLLDRGMSKGVFQPRDLNVEQVSDDELFVNVHHEAVFELHYPELYQLLFRSNLPPFEWQQALASPRMKPYLQRLELYSPGVTGLISRGNRTVMRADEGSWRGTLAANDLIA